ncbi:MAG TPA: hypothetical protein VNT56_06725, partial [Acidimicrobiales bacterium]|nr:hypothetical protein [Acidimicrobiales bacterium]
MRGAAVPPDHGAGPGNGPVPPPLDEADLIGSASARLLATCPERADRLAALSLLGVLLDHSDEDGRVRMPLDAVARELAVDPERAVRLLGRLVAAEAVRADGDAVVIVGEGSAPPGGLRPSRFLANVRVVLESEASDTPPAQDQPTERRTPDARSRPPRALAGVAVVVAAMALATAPSGEPATSLRSIGSPGSTGRAAWA